MNWAVSHDCYKHLVHLNDSGNTGACLPEINKARELAGLTSFAQATATDGGQLPLDSAYQLWGIPCDPLLPVGPTAVSCTLPFSSMYDSPVQLLEMALHVSVLLQAEEQFKGSNELLYKTAFASFEVSPDTPNCTEAVDHWNAAFTNFQEYVLPPPNDMSTKLYSNRDNISFVAVYNPAKTATADCRVFTCTRITPASSVAGYSNSNPAKTADSSSSLICLTTPDILTLNGPAPFTYVCFLKRYTAELPEGPRSKRVTRMLQILLIVGAQARRMGENKSRLQSSRVCRENHI